MKKSSSGNIISLLYQNFSVLLISLFCFLLGISVGVFTEIILSPENRESIQAFLDVHLFLSQLTGTDLPYVFLRSVASNLVLILIIAIAGLSIIGFPAALLILIYKGAALGFSATLLIDTLSFKGVLWVLLTLVPQNLILIPCYLIAAMASLSFTFSLLTSGPSAIKKCLITSIGSYLAFFFIIAVFVLGGCFVESFISPFLQQLLG
ncbi:MAG: stage II sporulation protein M [Eubacteriales bacterium]|nr:stage II sporulation protein M [Eubacteriales bacterium]MDD4583285.1 stage II sporulation protein M [Eubacteriales bacterium]